MANGIQGHQAEPGPAEDWTKKPAVSFAHSSSLTLSTPRISANRQSLLTCARDPHGSPCSLVSCRNDFLASQSEFQALRIETLLHPLVVSSNVARKASVTAAAGPDHGQLLGRGAVAEGHPICVSYSLN